MILFFKKNLFEDANEVTMIMKIKSNFFEVTLQVYSNRKRSRTRKENEASNFLLITSED